LNDHCMTTVYKGESQAGIDILLKNYLNFLSLDFRVSPSIIYQQALFYPEFRKL
jgi:hypothetical protein